MPSPAARNPWRNVLDPPLLRSPRPSDEATLAYVRRSNYFAEDGSLLLTAALGSLPPSWEENGNGKWDGYVPDVFFAFDDRGFDHRPDGSLTGWRAFAYYPVPGAFLPTNGSTDDVLIRLDPRMEENARGEPDAAIYEINLAVVEALIVRASVPIDPVDEVPLGVDLDLDGHLGRAIRVAFDAGVTSNRMRYVGRAKDDAELKIAPGLFPVGTEFFHTVRYLDVGEASVVRMSARMKEVRYAKKVRWASYEISRANAVAEARDQDESNDGVHEVTWDYEHGVFNRKGWILQGFIEAPDGSLRPQTFEETAYCEGCHGGIGATTDSIFSFSRKMSPDGPARGWFHWSRHDLRGIPEPRRIDGRLEYASYLKEAGRGDDFGGNDEVTRNFFDSQRTPRPSELLKLQRDIATLLVPSPARALDLDRAYMAIVAEGSFDRGRDAVLTPSQNAYDEVPLGQRTGILRTVASVRLAREAPGNPRR